MNAERLKKKFPEIFGLSREKVSVFFAPGRVNLIGEHTDYNDGWVMPCAIHMGTLLAIRKNDLGLIRFRAVNFEEVDDLAISKKYSSLGDHWYNYPLGVIDELGKKHGLLPQGVDMLFAGDLPIGAGLSSSASVEMATAVALDDLFDYKNDRLDLVKLAQRAENKFVGVNCGIMDQYAVGFGKEGHAVLLDCRSLESETIPVPLDEYQLVIVNTNVPRKLSGSLYNQRVDECNRALKELKGSYPGANSLRDVPFEALNELNVLIKDPVLRNRARHVISENQRVLQSADALKDSDLETFGLLMQSSHRSLKMDYEVTGRELDILAENASSHPGCIGARMTGAGFGGCTVNLVMRDLVMDFEFTLEKKYNRLTGITPAFYYPEISSGAQRLE